MDCNETRNISSADGPSPFDDVSAILIAIVLALLILATVIGNVFVIAAILLEKNLQSVANYLIVSLAVADLMVACLVMPLGAVNEIYSGWLLGPEICDIWTISDVLCCAASILHLVAIAIDRYWTVADINYTRERHPKRIGILITSVWVVSLGVSLAPQFGWKDPGYLDRIAEGQCLISQDPAYQVFATCATFYVPLFVILIVYWRIFQIARKRIRKRPGTTIEPPQERRRILRLVTRRPREQSTAFTIARSTPDPSSTSPEKTSSTNGANPATASASASATTPGAVATSTFSTTATSTTSTTATTVTATTKAMVIVAADSQPQIATTKKNREAIEKQLKRERKAAKTLVIITGAFIACWLPFFLATLLQAVCAPCNPPKLISSLFLWLGYFNSTLNPIIYTIFSPDFRQAFKKMLRIHVHTR